MCNKYNAQLAELQVKSQKYIVLKHLIEFGSITSFEAFAEYGITRLSAVIYNLRNDVGIDISSGTVTRRNRFGRPVHFSKYELR